MWSSLYFWSAAADRAKHWLAHFHCHLYREMRERSTQANEWWCTRGIGCESKCANTVQKIAHTVLTPHSNSTICWLKVHFLGKCENDIECCGKYLYPIHFCIFLCVRCVCVRKRHVAVRRGPIVERTSFVVGSTRIWDEISLLELLTLPWLVKCKLVILPTWVEWKEEDPSSASVFHLWWLVSQIYGRNSRKEGGGRIDLAFSLFFFFIQG